MSKFDIVQCAECHGEGQVVETYIDEYRIYGSCQRCDTTGYSTKMMNAYVNIWKRNPLSEAGPSAHDYRIHIKEVRKHKERMANAKPSED